jgi:predicted unusual protein kinase regulating ubiquinone biosynthesis (AarF/ABC1/UbiB family)
VLFPEVIDSLTSREVLTMTFMPGVKITRLDLLEQQGIAAEAVGRRLLQCFFEQLFVHRYFHADPHPGNFLVQPGPESDRPRLVVLDFGAVSAAPEALIEGLIEAMVAFFSRDGDKLLRAFERMGFVAAEGDRELVRRTLLLYFGRLLGLHARTPQALMNAGPSRLRRLLDPELELGQLRELARSFRSPECWFYIERALVMMFGLCGEISPQLDMLEVGFPYVMPLLQAQSEATRHG